MTLTKGTISKRKDRSSPLSIDSDRAAKKPSTLTTTFKASLIKKSRKRPTSEKNLAMAKARAAARINKKSASMTATTVIDLETFLTPVSAKKVSEVTRQVLGYRGKERLTP